MITGVHAIVYARDATRAREFFRDVLGLSHTDAGHGWLIFALPPVELGLHPTDDAESDGRQELYLMCDDIHTTVADLQSKGIEFTRTVADRGWGLLTTLRIPGGGDLHLYQPKHPTAINPRT